MSFKTELHCHTDYSSRCDLTPAAVAEKYVLAGYTTLVVTNHLKDERGNAVPFRDSVRRLYAAAEAVRQAAGDRLNVLTGMEISFSNRIADYLIFGLREEDLLGMDYIFDIQARELRYRTEKLGVLIIQAHPMRCYQQLIEEDQVDGIEVFNGHPHHDSNNPVAEAWAEHVFRGRSCIRTSGSDMHYAEQEPNGGIVTDVPITDMAQLVDVLRNGKYELLRG